ncbi:MAG: glycosyltransferase [Fibrobacteria bacterium]|nr:glycosyltransferase [Fibrobacteria bacterium]
MKSVLTILDCNNFWSPSGGGVRRYHLQKLEYFKQSPHQYIFMMQDKNSQTEKLNETTVIEHVNAFKFPGNWEYRFLTASGPIAKLIKKYNPDVIEVGSPYLMPLLVRRAIKKTGSHAQMLSFWHADFPVTYVGRFFSKAGRQAGEIMTKLAWWYARMSFKKFSGYMVSSRYIANRMMNNDIKPVFHVPLGVDTHLFNQDKKDPELIKELKAGKQERLTIFFPHRFMEEKGIRTLCEAYPEICKRLPVEPTLVFAGTGPDLALVKEMAARHKQVRYLGFISSREEMARWYASCEIGLALSGHETFGLSILESMASGQVLVGADTGAALEHVRDSGAGITIGIGDSRTLADAICELAKKEKKTMADKAIAYASQFTWEHCFKKEIETYQLVMKKDAGVPHA